MNKKCYATFDKFNLIKKCCAKLRENFFKKNEETFHLPDTRDKQAQITITWVGLFELPTSKAAGNRSKYYMINQESWLLAHLFSRPGRTHSESDNNESGILQVGFHFSSFPLFLIQVLLIHVEARSLENRFG